MRTETGFGPSADVDREPQRQELAFWNRQARIYLEPIAPPLVLGLFGFASATFIIAAFLAGWYGTPKTPSLTFAFPAMFGGVAQLLAAMWSYRARDTIATGMFGMFGAFWIAYGLLNGLGAAGVLVVPPHGPVPELGYWFITIAAITFFGAVAAVAESATITAILAVVAAGEACLAVRYVAGGHDWQLAAGWLLLVASWLAAYLASAAMLESSYGRVILPLGKLTARSNRPGETVTVPIEFAAGEAGVRRGQ